MLREQRLCRWWVYIVPKERGFYVGITTDPPNRLRQHGRPDSFYLKGPLERDQAVRLERKLKKFTRLEKRDIIKEALLFLEGPFYRVRPSALDRFPGEGIQQKYRSGHVTLSSLTFGKEGRE